MRISSPNIGFIFFILMGFLSSCEKVIDVKLNNSELKYVIEAEIGDTEGSAHVMLTQTKDFDEDNTFNGISGATVSIADNDGVPVPLVESTPGFYQAPALTAVGGHSYKLSVGIDGKTFTSVSKMPVLVAYDSIYIVTESLFGDTRKYGAVQYQDPPGKGNAYRFVQYVNGKKTEGVFIDDDDLTDGRLINNTLFFFTDDDEDDLKENDVVRIDMQCIDYPVYKFWYSLDQSATGESQSASPANPLSNIEGGALGYFSAHTLESKQITIPE